MVFNSKSLNDTIQYFLDSNNFFLSQENVFDSTENQVFFIQIISLETRIIYIDQENIGLSVFGLIFSGFNANSLSV